MELQRALFPVQYSDAFYDKLFTSGYYCLVGFTQTGELVAVASARSIPFEALGDVQPTNEAYIMTLGVKVPTHPVTLDRARARLLPPPWLPGTASAAQR